MNDLDQLFTSITAGLAIMSITAYLGGAWACFEYRRLSPWLIAASVGFLGEVPASAVGMLATQNASTFGLLTATNPSAVGLLAASNALGPLELYYLLKLVGNGLGLASTVTLVFGLGGALADLRRKLAISMDPKHVRH